MVYTALVVQPSSFFFTDPPTTEIYTLSLHDALPICTGPGTLPRSRTPDRSLRPCRLAVAPGAPRDRKSTRLNSSHTVSSYAVFCLKKKTGQRGPAHDAAEPRFAEPHRAILDPPLHLR